MHDCKPFKLSENFLGKYNTIQPPFGFNGLGELVYMRTYSRIKEDGVNEKWWETVQRVVEGTYNMQKRWIDDHLLGWNAHQAQYSAQEMYDRIFNMKFLPPGRGLWAMGSPITEERNIFAALNNCAFVSTETIKEDLSKSFVFLMDMSMLGVGVGFDTKGAGKIDVVGINKEKSPIQFSIPDTREGWVQSVALLIDHNFIGGAPIEFDYSQIRPMGTYIKGFGGVSAGAGPLKELHNNILDVMGKQQGDVLTVTTIVDLMNLIGKAVVAGNVRRTAEIAFGEYDDSEYLDLKNYDINPQRREYGWTSNNSIFAKLGMDYTNAASKTKQNGEPGYIWLENMRGYSRIKNGHDNKDHRVMGANPCAEQSLESYELCCLVDTFPNNHDNIDDFKRTLKFAYLYAKTVTLGKTHWSETNRVMLRNRRIGCSVSGIAQFISSRGIHELRKWLESGYDTIQKWDNVYSDWMVIPKSIKTTSVKPSGTVSLLAGATPGVHYPESRYYIRRIRLSKTSKLIEPLKLAGYKIESAFGDEKNTIVVEFPIDAGEEIRTVYQVSMWEQLHLTSFMQRHWADNQVSATITFDRDTEGDQISPALNYFQYELKGISFLPIDSTTYPQMPYEAITEEAYKNTLKKLKNIDFSSITGNKAIVDRFCDSDVCEIE